jgi:serine/threonine protein kinase
MDEEKIANKYVLREFIGKGKFGSVYKGEKIGIDEKKVAIKFEAKNAEFPLLKKESRILEYLARNGLQDIVPIIYWYGLHRNYMCVVMSYLGETSLAMMPSDSLDSWFQSAIIILEKIHLYGVIHRDLKPGHFLFSNGKWKLIDFGFACFFSASESASESESREFVIGTPNYISYNVHLGKDPGKKDDMISLGYIFLEKYRGLSWSSSPSSTCSNPGNYPVNHLSHPINQWKQAWKAPDIFFKEISDIPFLTKYMQKYYN